MSWTDLHQRNEVIDEVLARAARDADDPDLFRHLPELNRLFGGVDGLLLALQYRWRNHMQARMDVNDEAEWADRREVARQLASEQPALIAVLDRYAARRARVRVPADA